MYMCLHRYRLYHPNLSESLVSTFASVPTVPYKPQDNPCTRVYFGTDCIMKTSPNTRVPVFTSVPTVPPKLLGTPLYQFLHRSRLYHPNLYGYPYTCVYIRPDCTIQTSLNPLVPVFTSEPTVPPKPLGRHMYPCLHRYRLIIEKSRKALYPFWHRY